MKTLALTLILGLAGTAAAQQQPKTEPQKPALNLRLDDGTAAAPRVTFGPPPATQTKDEREKGLPELGGRPSDAYNRTLGSGVNPTTNRGVIPSAMDPNVNRD